MARALTPEDLLAWKDRLGRLRSSGRSAAEFCRREQLSVANFYYWRRKLNARTDRRAKAESPISARRATDSRAVSARDSILPTKRGRSTSRQADATPGATFFQIPLPEPRGGGWIEIVSADGTVIRLPQQNLAAFELALAALSGRVGT